MNNKGKAGKTVKKSPRPSHNGRPVSVKGTSSGKNISGISDRAGRRKKSSRKKKPQNTLKHIVLAVVIVIVVLAVCALGYGFFEMRMEQSDLEQINRAGHGKAVRAVVRNSGRQKVLRILMWSFLRRIHIPDLRFLLRR